MNWFKINKFPFLSKNKKKVLLSDQYNNSLILDVEECQCGMIVKRDGSYLILIEGGKVHGYLTCRWFPHSGFTCEEIRYFTKNKNKNE